MDRTGKQPKARYRRSGEIGRPGGTGEMEDDYRSRVPSIWNDRSVHALVAFVLTGILVAIVFMLSS